MRRLIGVAALAVATPAQAVPNQAFADQIAVHAGELPASAMITVTAPATAGRVLPPGADALIDRQPRSVADALRGLPGVSVRANSRGEAIPRVRGSEERQTQVFLDGAPLVVPWDGRINLGLIPAGLIGGAEVRKGAVPIEYGTNAVAGVIDLTSRRGGAEAANGFIGVAQAGTLGLASASGVFSADVGGADLTLAAAHNSQDAAPVASLAALPFSQADSRRRTNTQADANSVFAAIGGEVADVVLRASVLHFAAAQGVAPESDRNPALFAPRYWRYPSIDFTQAIVSAQAQLADTATLRLVGWQQWFAQTIDAYRSIDFAALRTREHNDDSTQGGRLTLSHRAGSATLRWSASAQTSRHIQTDTAFPPGVAATELRYRQSLLTVGVEADVPLGAATALTAGFGYDRSANPQTGDKPAQPVKSAMAFSTGLRHNFGDTLTLTMSGGRRTRFPSARELFGEALGRFLPNPALKPESVWLADAELTWRQGGVTATINPFVMRTSDAISQRVVRVGPQSLRQRFNLAGATAFGVDALLLVPIGSDWTVELTGTALDARADAGNAPFQRQIQRPAHEAMLAALGVKYSRHLDSIATTPRGPIAETSRCGGIRPTKPVVKVRSNFSSFRSPSPGRGNGSRPSRNGPNTFTASAADEWAA
jgi:iron complex outermembrane recepter protein